MHIKEMIAKHPGFKGEANTALIHCIEECYDCAQTCASCADASLAEDDVKMLARCVRLRREVDPRVDKASPGRPPSPQ